MQVSNIWEISVALDTSQPATSSVVSLTHLWNIPARIVALPVSHLDTSSLASLTQLSNM